MDTELDKRNVFKSQPNATAGFPRKASQLKRGIVRHPLLSVFILALALRSLTIFISMLLPNNFFASDDGTYMALARGILDGSSGTWPAQAHNLLDATFTFVGPLTALFWVAGGPSEILGQLFVAIIGAAVAVVVARITLEYLPPVWALVAGVLVAAYPSYVLWSSLVLKDAAVWLLAASLALVVAKALRATSRRDLLRLSGLAAALLFALGHLRQHSTVIAAFSLVIAAASVADHRRLQRILGAGAIAIIIPMLVGLGPAGMYFVFDTGSLEQRRILNAENANSAFVEDPVFSPGTTVNPSEPDEEPPSTAAASTEGGIERDLRHLPRGLTAMLFEPVPWTFEGTTTMKLARLEMVLWYPVLVLAIAGLWRWKRFVRITVFPVMFGAGSLFVYGLAEGNLGTAFRHRGEFIWVVILLAVIGAFVVTERRRQGPRSAS